MEPIPLHICTVAEAKNFYLNNKPMNFTALQTNDDNPYILSYDELDETFIFDGSLKISRNGSMIYEEDIPDNDRGVHIDVNTLNYPYLVMPGKEDIIVDEWLKYNRNGPYYGVEEDVFYYLGGKFSIYGKEVSDLSTGGSFTSLGKGWLQICVDPINVLSTDCMDEVHIWIPDQ